MNRALDCGRARRDAQSGTLHLLDGVTLEEDTTERAF
jgi:hypothetical protein